MFDNHNIILTVRGPWGVQIEIASSIAFLGLLLIVFVGMQNPLYAAMLFVILFGSILLHELGHAWGNIIQGVPVRRVVIFGGGGFCESARTASVRQQELIVAMGPLVNLTLWAVAGLAMNLTINPYILWGLYLTSQINLFLFIFNMLPVQPLDGGRLLQLVLMRVTDGRSATKIAGGVGLVASVLWIPAMIACFVFFGVLLFFIPSIRLHWQMFKV